MGDLLGHGPGRVTACSLSGEGRKVNPCTTTRAVTGVSVGQCWVWGERGKEQRRTLQQRPNAAVKQWDQQVGKCIFFKKKCVKS